MKFKLKSPAFVLTSVVIIAGLVCLMSKSDIIGALFVLPFALGPLFISLIVAAVSHFRSCQNILIVGSVLYSAWFGYAFLDIFYWHPDPQSAIGLLFVGALSLPVMIPIWILTLFLRQKKHAEANKTLEATATSAAPQL